MQQEQYLNAYIYSGDSENAQKNNGDIYLPLVWYCIA